MIAANETLCTCQRDWLDAGVAFDFDRKGANWHRRMNREMCECCGAIYPVPVKHPHVTRFGDGTKPEKVTA